LQGLNCHSSHRAQGRAFKAIRREMRRRAAIEPVIGHLKEDHRMGRNYLTGRDGDRSNAVLAAAGYNFSLLLRWFEELLRVLSLILCHALLAGPLHLTRCRKTFLHGRLIKKAWWKGVISEQRPIPHNRWFFATRGA
jgi:hypothetical protein